MKKYTVKIRVDGETFNGYSKVEFFDEIVEARNDSSAIKKAAKIEKSFSYRGYPRIVSLTEIKE